MAKALDVSLRQDTLAASVSDCVQGAAKFAYDQMKEDGHWCLEVRSSISFTVQWICIRQTIGPPLPSEEAAKFKRWLLSQQNPHDGSWGLAPPAHDWPGDVSTTVEAYFGLKMLGTPVADEAMRQARAFILAAGGVNKVGVLTQLVLALFGIISWEGMAQVPAELMALPDGVSPINIYSFSYWSRVSAVAVMLLKHHRPVYPLRPVRDCNDCDQPLGASFLDELFLDSNDRTVKSTPSLSSLWEEKDMGRLCCTAIDKVASMVEPVLRRTPLRSYCISQCTKFIVDHLDEGGYGSLTISNFLGLFALNAAGFPASHPILRHIRQAMEVSLWEDSKGRRMQVTVGPVWDTALMALGLLESNSADGRTDLTSQWLKDRQILTTNGDYLKSNPAAALPGGWSFQYCNEYYPDNDDTLVCLFAVVMQNPREMASPCATRALDWLLSMQGSDGGWGAYDIDNNNKIANLFPFADGVEFFDPSVPDITGRVLEVLGYMLNNKLSKEPLRPEVIQHMRKACARALAYLAKSQNKVTGTWWSRWHVNYLNGTSSVLCALPYFEEREYRDAGILVKEPLSWLKALQHKDGGWGECLDSYRVRSMAGRGLQSTPTQTAWAVMALLAFLPPSDSAVTRGIQYLIRTQVTNDHGTTWDQEEYVSVGFPNTLWLDFGCMRHGYPMIALGRYLHACRRAAL